MTSRTDFSSPPGRAPSTWSDSRRPATELSTSLTTAAATASFEWWMGLPRQHSSGRSRPGQGGQLFHKYHTDQAGSAASWARCFITPSAPWAEAALPGGSLRTKSAPLRLCALLFFGTTAEGTAPDVCWPASCAPRALHEHMWHESVLGAVYSGERACL